MPTEHIGSFALMVQRLSASDAVLAVADLAWRRANGPFATADVRDLFDALRVPVPTKNLSDVLGKLRTKKLLVKSGSGSVLTPEGQEKAGDIIAGFSYDDIAAELAASLVELPLFAHAQHELVSPAFAPVKWRSAIARLHETTPFERSVFLMTRFPSSGSEGFTDPVADAIPVLRKAVEGHGLTLHLASDKQIEDDLWGNVGGYIWACRFGMGLFETRGPKSDELNDNMLIELGAMLTLGRRCAILRDKQAPPPPTDLTAQIWKDVDLDDLDALSATAHRWLATDLGFGACDDCPE